MKTCAKCGKAKARKEFNKAKNRKDGLYPYCRECSRAEGRKYYKNNKEYRERAKARSLEHAKSHPEKHREQTREWARKNRIVVNKRNRKWKKENSEKTNEISRQWRRNNPAKHAAIQARRRAAKLCRTPPWADLEAIKKFYENCPEGHHVDHIIPLQGETVSGLHILKNLQYLLASENLRKGNHFAKIRI